MGYEELRAQEAVGRRAGRGLQHSVLLYSSLDLIYENTYPALHVKTLLFINGPEVRSPCLDISRREDTKHNQH